MNDDQRQWRELTEEQEHMSTALYVLVDEYRAAATQLADLELDEQTIADTLEGLSGALEVKAQNVAAFVRNLETSAEAIKAAEAKMALRRKAIEARAERIRAYLKYCMEGAQISKIECPWFVLSIRQNPPSVKIEDPAMLPAECMRQAPPPPPEPDKTKIRALLQSGEDVPGARIVQGTRLEIK